MLAGWSGTVIPAKAGIHVTSAGMAPELIDLSAEPERALAEAEAALRDGGVVLLPTDTVYGLAALTPDATDELFVLKGRPADRSIAVLVADRQAAESLADDVPPPLAELMDRHWPGPLTVVLPRARTPGQPQVGGDRDTVGVRCPDHDWLRRLLADVGPLATTSANRHAEPTRPDVHQVLTALSIEAAPGSAKETPAGASIAVAIDGGPCTGEASTVVAWHDGQLKVLRPGPLDL